MPSRVFIDTNIVLEYKPLEEWDWSKLNLTAPEIHVTAPVIRELDKHKYHRVKGKQDRAKKFLVLFDDIPKDGTGLPRKGFRLFIYLSEMPQHLAAGYGGLSLETQDEKFIGACLYAVKYSNRPDPDYVLSEDRLVRLRAEHTPGSRLIGLEPPKEYRFNPKAPEASDHKAIALEIWRLIKEAARDDSTTGG